MASRVVMPKLTDTMEEGVLLAWKKREGDPVHAGEAIAEIETDKAVMDLEAFAPGILRKILVHDGETVQSGTLIAVIAEADEDIAAALADGVVAAPPLGLGLSPSPPRSRMLSPASAPAAGTRSFASPRAKALAAERGIDLSTVTGTGPGGRIVEDDVMKVPAPTTQTLPTEPISR